jgi:hypothetical protein
MGALATSAKTNQKVKTADVVLTNASLTSTFAGSACSGTWGLFMRDVVKGNPATFKSSVLTIAKL